MGVRERLSLEGAAAEPLIASEHVHRYTLAARLCEGLRVVDLACGSGYGTAILRETAKDVLGVDGDAGVVDMARVTVGGEHDVRFEAAAPVDFLERELVDQFDAIVYFEDSDHSAVRETILERLALHAAAGLRIVVAIPSGERAGYEQALAAFERFDQVTVLYQFTAEGSLIRADEPSELDGEFVLPEHGEREWASHFIACVNLEERLREVGDSARMRLAVAPQYNRRVRELERANSELWRENARIGRQRIGSGGSAAVMARERVEQLQQRVEEHQRRVQELERILAAPRHRWVERVRERIRRWPAIDRTARAVGTWLHGRSR